MPDVGGFPSRYEPLERLGQGGGGEVWAARDRLSDDIVALKLLREGAEEGEMLALVREATVLSGVEGLGVPHVIHFGRLPDSGRAYMVRELVAGHSLADLLSQDADAFHCLRAVVQAANQVSQLHGALLLHGDIKPANIIVGPEGTATLVDLGLAAHWREGGARPEGLTPRYAAPELFVGDPLTPRAEVFALGATAVDVIERASTPLSVPQADAVREVLSRATRPSAEARYPSADEFAQALGRALRLDDELVLGRRRVWSIVGIDEVHAQLMTAASALGRGAGLLVAGASGAGKTTLARRLSWSLGVAGRRVAWLTAASEDDFAEALTVALGPQSVRDAIVVVDDAQVLDEGALNQIESLREREAAVVLVVNEEAAQRIPGATYALFQVPPLADGPAAALIKRMIPSLSDALVRHLIARTGGLPGVLRAVVAKLEGSAVATIDDIERCLDEVPVPAGVVVAPAEIHALLARGRFERAADYLQAYAHDDSLIIALARAKLATGRGDPRSALLELRRVKPQLPDSGELLANWHLQTARAHLRAGAYEDAEAHATQALEQLGSSVGAEGPIHDPERGVLVSDALAVCGLTQSLGARHEEGAATLERSVAVARAAADQRTLAIALGSLAFALQRNDRLDEAQTAHEEALQLAEAAGDAGHIATTRLNLAGIAKTRGDIAAALEHLEAAVDMGRRSGRASSVRQALLNLANLNLYLGRHARAQASIDALNEERESLTHGARAQLLALEAELAVLNGDLALASERCRACASAYQTMQRPVDAAEALLEYVLIEVRRPGADSAELQEALLTAEAWLSDSGAHRPLLLLARGRVAQLAASVEQAREAFDEAIAAASQSGQREWLWRALEGRATLRADQADPSGATHDRSEALKVLEQIAQELPRDLREVYWNEPRRRELKKQPRATVMPNSMLDRSTDINAPTQLGLVREERLTRVLAINREIAGEYDLDRLLEKVTDHAIALVGAERGFVLLRSKSGEQRLSVHAARDQQGEEPHQRFSRSIAERVVATGEPFVALDAPGDERVKGYVSVHSLMLRSVACVPIRSRARVIGALYLETRLRSAALFDDELPTLAALADQVAIAIETVRLVTENRQRAQALEKANEELVAARAKLEELLGRRTEQLQSTKRSLRSARAVLRGHFGYGDIVGTSAAMRRVYAMIERIKDADVPVLLTGESGTGKEIIARSLHNAGARAKQRMVGVNCGAIPEHLLESELFGHMRGAFTGADRDKKGLFRELDGGTILLDEIGEMPQKMQAGLLRVLQEKVVRPVGGVSEVSVNTRVIAATHRHLEQMVRDGGFREDLYYRLNVIEIKVPPLRDRAEDIPLLIDHFLRLFAARYERQRRTVSREALKVLAAYAWPGNVRQLENVLLNAWILNDGAELEPQDFELPEGSLAPSSSIVSEVRVRPQTADDAEQHEHERMLEALATCNWNRAKAAQKMGMPRRTFYRRLKKYGIQ